MTHWGRSRVENAHGAALWKGQQNLKAYLMEKIQNSGVN